MPNERRPGQQNKVGLRSGRVDVVTLSSMRSSPPRACAIDLLPRVVWAEYRCRLRGGGPHPCLGQSVRVSLSRGGRDEHLHPRDRIRRGRRGQR